MPIPVDHLQPALLVPYDDGIGITHIPFVEYFWRDEFFFASKKDSLSLHRMEKELAKPTAKYLEAVREEAKRCHADAIEIVAAGNEAVVFELFKNGTSLQAMIRLEKPRPVMNTAQEVMVAQGDPDHHEADYHTSLPTYHRYYVGFAEEGANNTGVELRVMPKIYRLENSFPYSHPKHLAAEVEASALSSHSNIMSKDAAANMGFYINRQNKPVLVFFDPGRPHTDQQANIRQEKATLEAWQSLAQPGEVHARAQLDTELRKEIEADAKRIYEGKPTLYATRVRRLEKSGRLQDILTSWEPSLQNKVWEHGNWPPGIH